MLLPHILGSRAGLSNFAFWRMFCCLDIGIASLKDSNLKFYCLASPVDFFELVVNPTSFGHTIENIFHLSFLVKDGLVKIFLNEHELPVVEPVKDVSDASDIINGEALQGVNGNCSVNDTSKNNQVKI